MRITHFVAAAGIAAALACGAPKTSPAPPISSSTPTASTASSPIPPPTGAPSASPVATAAATASSAVEAPPPEPITCKTEDDCWVAEDRTPMRRPKALRGKRPKPCHGTEHTPKCEAGACAVTTWKC
jgi:hypothetical protein